MSGNRRVVLWCSSSNMSRVGFYGIPWNKQEMRRRVDSKHCNCYYGEITGTCDHSRMPRMLNLYFTKRSSKKLYEIPTASPGIRKGFYCL